MPLIWKPGGLFSKQHERPTLGGMINCYTGGNEPSISVVTSLWSSLYIAFGLGKVTCLHQWDISKHDAIIGACLLGILSLGLLPPFCKEVHPILLKKEVLEDKKTLGERGHLVEKLGASTDKPAQHQGPRHERKAFLVLTQPSCRLNAAI